MSTFTVIKRDGTRVAFNISCILAAITKAAEAVGIHDHAYILQVTEAVMSSLSNKNEVSINEIQHQVENHLMTGIYPEIARAYIEYRHDRDVTREKQSKLNQDIKGLIEQTNVDILNENANKDAKIIPTQRDLLAGIVAKHYAKQHLLPTDVVAAHEKGELHFHDLDYSPFFPMFNCMLIDIEGMLTKGFKMGNADIATPKSIATATSVCAQIIAQVASHIYGGTTINRIDEVLEPYVVASRTKYEEIAAEWQIPDVKGYVAQRLEKEVFDAFQSLMYEINTLHTANGQTPFVTVSFGLGTSYESKLIQKSILQNAILGLGKKHKTAIFPKLVFIIKDGVNHKKTDPNYDIKQLALECSSKRLYPDILNYEQVIKVTGSFKTPMGCRSFLGAYEENGVEIHEGRNNLGVVSINLPRIAIEAEKSEERFYEILDQRLAMCKKALMARIARFDNVKARVAPILYMEGACGVRLKADDNVADIFKNGRASISLGYIGVHETIIALFGNETHMLDSVELQEKGIQIIAKLKTAVDKWKDETGYAFSLYSTPSENLCSRFCSLDAKQFGSISDVTDKGYYTNSFHLDVAKKTNPYAKILFEMPYPALASGGFISYGEYPNMQNNLEALENVWDFSYDKIPYYGTNTPADECYDCGFTGEFSCTSKGFTCPKCGNHDPAKVSVIRRVCGYLGSPDARPFNIGKQIEVSLRCKHL